MKRYIDCLETLPDAAVLTDDGGKIIFANGRVCSLLGYDPPDLVGRTSASVLVRECGAELTHPLGPARPGAASEAAGAARPELVAVRADGDRLPVDVTSSPVQLGRHQVTVSLIREATAARLPDSALETAAILEDTLERTIEAWARTVELRDRITEGHTQRVTEMTVRIASRLDVPEEELMHIRRGSMLHDVGKLLVPDAILQKPGPLTAEERAVMKRHAEYAYEILGPIDALRPALDIPTYHHERWDGSGYPRGLAGSTIPLSARIFAVADAYDAITSERPYERAASASEALDYIAARSGTEFDPQVVEAMLALATDGNPQA
jgi:PAS domain S-box-containing protein